MTARRSARAIEPDDHPVELSAPDITRHRAGNTRVDYVWSFNSGQPGPHAMIVGIVHGNELCGALALDFLLRERVRPTRGKLTLAFANVAAFRRFDPARPTASRFVEEDFNRVWSPTVLSGARDSVELRRARLLREFVEAADVLLDLHSMQHVSAPLALAGLHPKGRALAFGVGVPEVVVVDAGHANGTRMRDFGDFGDPRSDKASLLVECGQHWAGTSAERATEVALRFLNHVDMLDPALAAAHLPAAAPPPQRIVEVTEAVTIESEDFRFAQDYRGMEVVPRAGTVVAHDSGRAVATPYDDCVLIMPSRRLGRGQTAVRLGRYLPDDAAQ